jgi:multicomponent Na+:H+ antiporter subunit G
MIECVVEYLGMALLLVGAFFFFAGTVGLLRFPDVYTRLHALAKADNLGLGFVGAWTCCCRLPASPLD